MDRRGWGAVVLAITVLLAIAVPSAFGLNPRTAGKAVRTPPPPPPTVGDCILSPLEGTDPP